MEQYLNILSVGTHFICWDTFVDCTCGVMVVIIRNEHGSMSSNPE